MLVAAVSAPSSGSRSPARAGRALRSGRGWADTEGIVHRGGGWVLHRDGRPRAADLVPPEGEIILADRTDDLEPPGLIEAQGICAGPRIGTSA